MPIHTPLFALIVAEWIDDSESMNTLQVVLVCEADAFNPERFFTYLYTLKQTIPHLY